MSTETKEEVKDDLVEQFASAYQHALVLGENDSWSLSHERRYLEACRKADELKAQLKSQLAKVTQERDALREALERALLEGRHFFDGSWVEKKGRAALAMGNGEVKV